MKLLAFSCLAAYALGEVPKCAQIPKGRTRRYATPKTIESGENNPAAVSFIIDNRATLMSLFKPGKDDLIQDKLIDGMWYLDTFAGAMDDYVMGQYFQVAKQHINDMVREGTDIAKAKFGEEFGALYRDNTQRSARVLKDLVMNKSIMMKLEAGDMTYIDDLIAVSERDITEGAKVYNHFVSTYAEDFHPMTTAALPMISKIRSVLDQYITVVMVNEKAKGKYRQIVNEIPLIYQFFNDNIDFIEISNEDKSLTDAVATDILMTLAEQEGNTQIESMINRNMKFIKKIMADRALQQQKDKAVRKVMEKNKELMEAAWSEEEFNRIVEERGLERGDLTTDMRAQIWNEVKVNMAKWQSEQIDVNMEMSDHEKKMIAGKKQMNNYQRCMGIVGLMPDELLESVAEMVQESCPELNLMSLETADMKVIFEQQDVKFINQLMEELHMVCEMFGLIAEDKVMTKNVGGVEVQFYAEDYTSGPKVEWE